MNDLTDTTALARRIEALLAAKQAEQAIPVCEQLNRTAPEYARGWYLTSQVAMHLKKPQMAQLAIERALKLEPAHIAWLLQSGLCLAALPRARELCTLVEGLAGQAMQTAYQCSTLGALLCQAGRHAEAAGYYQQAAEMQPNDHQHAYNLACLYRSLGKLADAESYFDKAIALEPSDYESYKLRSDLRKQLADNNHIAQLNDLLERGVANPRDRVQLLYALAKEYEDLQEWDASFSALKQGADLRRSYMQYDIANDLGSIDAIKRHFDAPLFATPPPGSASAEPIFVLGMPRTGTTLVERILSNHSAVYSAGELTNFSMQMMAQVASSGRPANREALIAATTQLDFAQLGDAYIESTRPFTGQVERFVDKLPLNYLYVGLIHLALPNAKIINLTRHPVDTCYSVYKQLFMDAYPFSYSLEELGHYYVAYEQLMAHWRQVLPNSIHTISYESLVTDLDGETRRLLDFCELDFEKACLDFTTNAQASTTASAAQVRQPLYTSSVGKWTHYKRQLQPLIEILEAAGIDCS